MSVTIEQFDKKLEEVQELLSPFISIGPREDIDTDNPTKREFLYNSLLKLEDRLSCPST